MKNTLPLFYHPTNVLFVDDELSFLNLVVPRLNRIFPFVLRDNTREAFNYLRTHTYKYQELSEYIAKRNYDIFSEKTDENIEIYDVNLRALQGDLGSPERFKKIVVAVIDRHMPNIDGLDFCASLRENFPSSLKIILLTGATKLNEAIEAFNKGKIDAFIEKASPLEMMNQLNSKLQELSWQQFQEISHHLTGFLTFQCKPLSDQKFIEQFKEIFKKENIVEFYVIDSSGSLLLLDTEAKAKILLVQIDEDFEMMYELAKDSGALRDTLQGLRDRQLYPFTPSKKGPLFAKGDTWDDIMVPMQKVPGREIFYSLVDSAKLNLIGFNQYMGEIWPKP